MVKNIFLCLFSILPLSLFGENDNFDTLSIRPIGVDYSKYSGMNKLYIVGECDGMTGNQVVIFQNRPSFDYFETNQTYSDEQAALEKAIWSEILDGDSESIVVKGRWYKYNDRMVFLSHQILWLNKIQQINH